MLAKDTGTRSRPLQANSDHGFFVPMSLTHAQPGRWMRYLTADAVMSLTADAVKLALASKLSKPFALLSVRTPQEGSYIREGFGQIPQRLRWSDRPPYAFPTTIAIMLKAASLQPNRL